MYYAFFETRNEAQDNSFFSCIADVFCTIVVKSIISLYDSGAFSHSDITNMDWETMDNNVKKNGEALYFLNCNLFPELICGNEGCKAGHRVVLTTNQVEKLSKRMKIKKDAILKASSKSKMDRFKLQYVFQSYRTANSKQMEIINMDNISDTQATHNTYLDVYIERTNTRIRNRPDAQGFVYVRAAGADSDYAYFVQHQHANIPNVEACDCFQGVRV